MATNINNKLKGIAASDGIGIAPAYPLVDPDLSFKKKQTSEIGKQKKDLDKALEQSKKEITIIRDKAKQSLGKKEAEVFSAHLEMLSDPEFIGQIKNTIDNKKLIAPSAMKEVSDQFVATFSAMKDNTYMQERALDVKDITKRVLSHLLGVSLPDLALIKSPVVVVAHDLAPSDTAQLDPKYIRGIITDLGGRTSHTAIMSRTLEIPAIVGTKSATKIIPKNKNVIIDGLSGTALFSPSQKEITNYKEKQTTFLKQKEEWQKLKTSPSKTKDGVKHLITANIGTPDDITGVKNNGGEGVGLFRTEFLYMHSTHWPTEEEQFSAYKKAVSKMSPKPVVIRTMDIGGDKGLTYAHLPKENNPFMGYRAIRISLDRKELFRTQLKALLRASNYGNLWIMFPMIATLDELRTAKKIYKQEKEKLLQAGKKVGKIKIGMMMEIPAAAVLADQFAPEVDFMSIGTNDLIGYSMAADRTNQAVSYLYQPYNPSILRLIKHIIDSCHKYNKFAAMCGEMAGDQLAVPLLIGMGLDEFSMSATSILKTRSLFKKLDSKKMSTLAQEAVQQQTSNDVIRLVRSRLDHS